MVEQKLKLRVVSLWNQQGETDMVFKERLFYGHEVEEDFPPQHDDLEAHVANFLASVGGLDASDITVVAKGNVILLSGMVQTPEEVDRAQEAAESVPGVDEVINRIVSSEFRSPSESS